MDRPKYMSLTLPDLSLIGATMLALLGGAGFLHNSVVDRFDRQNDLIAASLRAELLNFKVELQKLDTDVNGVDEKMQEVDNSVAVSDFQSDLVKDDVVEVIEDVVVVKDDVKEVKVDVVGVKEDVIEVKEKVDVIGSDLDNAADKLAVIQSALIVGFKDNEAVKLILTDERLSLLLPAEIYSSEPQKAAALDGDSTVTDFAKIEPKLSIAEYCQDRAGPLTECYEKYLKKAEKKLLIGLIDE